jgi:L-iditol 2-dehydrogenase
VTLPTRMQGAMLLGPSHIEIRDVDVATPGPHEMLVKMRAATTCGTDVKVYKRGGHPRMLTVPTLFGHEMAGQVAAVGTNVTQFVPGERVVIANSAACGTCRYCVCERENLCESLAYLNGAFAEYIHVPARFVARSVYRLPAELAFERAALSEPLACVLHGLSACHVDRYRRMPDAQAVVYGAGPIGLLFVAALARAGLEVIVADPNPSRIACAKRMGATHGVHIQRGGEQAERVRVATHEERGAAVVIECTGMPEVWNDAIATAEVGGLVNLFGGCAPGTEVALDTHRLHYSEITLKGVYHHRPETFVEAIDMLSDPTFPADELLSSRMPISRVSQALQQMIEKQALKVVITNDS